MITRMLIIMLIAVLALPVATLTRPAETSHSPWSEVAVAAKGKKHKKKDKKPQFTTVTRTIRQPVTRTFTSTGPITIPSGAPTTSNKGPANPYPSAIAVSGFSNGTITDVNLILTDYSHTVPTDVDVLLSTSDGRQALVLSDVSNDPVTSIDLTLDDEAAASMPAVEQGVDLTSGTFRPTNHTYYDDSFATPAPALNGNVALSGFDGTDPNGTWRLWVTDNAGGDHGDLSGWALQITAEVDTGTVDEQVPVTKTKKHKKHGKKRR